MVIKFSDIANLEEFKHDTLIQKEGTDEIISLVGVYDIQRLPEWIGIGDLLIISYDTSSYSLDNAALIKKMNEIRCSGIILLCDEAAPKLKLTEQSYPILIHTGSMQKMRSVIQKVMNLIQLAVQHNSVIPSAVHALLVSGKDFYTLGYSYLLKMLGIDLEAYYCVSIIACQSSEANVLQYISNYVQNQHDKLLYTFYENYLVLLYHARQGNRKPIEKEMHRILRDTDLKFPGSEIKIAMGQMHYGIVNVKDSFLEALSVLDMIALLDRSQRFFTFEQLGIYRFLYEIRNKKVFEKYCDNVFHKIFAYDKENQTNLFETLEHYMKYDRNLRETADALHIHVNTLRYRIARIEEILDMDMQKTDVLLELYTAMRVRKMIYILDDDAFI